MTNQRLMIYSPKKLPEWLLRDVRDKLFNLSIPMEVYFCIAALSAGGHIEEKNIVGIKLSKILSSEERDGLMKTTDEISDEISELQFVEYQDIHFKSYFDKEGPIFTI